MIDLFTSLSTATYFACLALILGTSSFISGLQLVRGTSATVEGKIHRFNGYTTLSIYVVIAAFSIYEFGASALSIIGWIAGLSLLSLKLWIIKRRKKRGYRYVSWMGSLFLLVLIFVLLRHLDLF